MLEDILTERAGALCEVRNPRNFLLFAGRVGEVTNTHVLVTGSDGIPASRGAEVKLTIHGGDSLVTVGGRLLGHKEDAWVVGELVYYRSAEDRAFFRQYTSAKGEVLRLAEDPEEVLSPLDPEERFPFQHTSAQGKVRRLSDASATAQAEPRYPVHLMDISLGGVLFHSNEPFHTGETLILQEVALLPRIPPFSFKCLVRRLSPDESGGYRCGCSFESTDDSEQDRLCQAIFALQRQELQWRQRGY